MKTFELRALLKLVLRCSLPFMDERNVLWVNFNLVPRSPTDIPEPTTEIGVRD